MTTLETDVAPNMEHPIVSAALRLVRKAADGDGCVLAPRDELALERIILDRADDEDLADGIIGLVGLAAALFAKEGSEDAAVAIVRTLAHLEPELAQFEETAASGEAEVAVERFKEFAGTRASRRGPGLGEAPPSGSVSVKSLNIAPPAPRWRHARGPMRPRRFGS